MMAGSRPGMCGGEMPLSSPAAACRAFNKSTAAQAVNGALHCSRRTVVKLTVRHLPKHSLEFTERRLYGCGQPRLQRQRQLGRHATAETAPRHVEAVCCRPSVRRQLPSAEFRCIPFLPCFVAALRGGICCGAGPRQLRPQVPQQRLHIQKTG